MRSRAVATPWPSERRSVRRTDAFAVSVPVRRTAAPGITAPLGSCTTTRSVPVARGCADADAGSTKPASRNRRMTGLLMAFLPSAFDRELLRIDRRVDLHLRDGPLFARRARHRAADLARELDPVAVLPVLEIQRVVRHRRRLLLQLLQLPVGLFAHLPALLFGWRSEEHTSELHSRGHLVCRLL